MSEPLYDAQDAAIADLAQQRRDLILKIRELEYERDVWRAKVPLFAAAVTDLRSRLRLIQDRARELLQLLPSDLPSNEFYAAVDNLSALVPVDKAP